MSSGDFGSIFASQSIVIESTAAPIDHEETTIGNWVTTYAVAESVLIPIVIIVFVANLFVLSSVAELVLKHNGSSNKNYFGTRRLKPGHIIVMNLAFSDLMVGTSSITLVLLEEMDSNIFTPYTCLLRLGFFTTPCIASVLSMAAIAGDRYLTIMHPLKYMMHVKIWKAVFVALLAWVLSSLISFLPLIGWNNYDDMVTTSNHCSFVSMVTPSYVFFVSIGLFLPVLVTTFVLYFRIYRVSKRHARRIADTESSIGDCGLRHAHSSNSIFTRMTVQSSRANLDQVHRPTSDVFEMQVPQAQDEHQPQAFEQNRRKLSENRFPKVTTLQPPSEHNMHKERYYRRSNSLYHPITLSTMVAPPPMKTSKSLTDLQTVHHVHQQRRRGSSFGDFLTHVWHRLQSHESTLKSINRKRREKKAFRTLAIVMGFFFIMWSPFLILMVVQAICGTHCTVSVSVLTCFLLLGISNSAVNPLVYTYTNRDIRKYFCQCYCGCLNANDSLASSEDQISNKYAPSVGNLRELPLPMEAKYYSFVTPIIARKSMVYENAAVIEFQCKTPSRVQEVSC